MTGQIIQQAPAKDSVPTLGRGRRSRPTPASEAVVGSVARIGAPVRWGRGLFFFVVYLFGLTLSGISLWLALAIGPFDGFAAEMILAPGLVGAAGGAGIAWAAGAHRRPAALVLVFGAAWAAGAILFVGLFASMGR